MGSLERHDSPVGPGEVNGDGASGLLAAQASTGEVWPHPGNGSW